MLTIKEYIKRNTALIIFHILFLFICLANLNLGKYFIGWDALNPEFNPGLNLERAFSGFWQENYGVGLLGGHGFSATLPHTLITFLMNLFLPNWAVRTVFTLLCFYLGGLGMFFLVKKILEKVFSDTEAQSLSKYFPWVSLIASLYYQYNLGTVQQFYVQLEAFIVHFAALPWLFFSLINLLSKFNKRNLIIFALINFLATVQGFIPPLFVVYFISLVIFLVAKSIRSREQKNTIKKSIIIILLTILINSYWLSPFIYYTLNMKQNYIASYNNLTSTNDFIQKSEKYGTLPNVALIKGFYLDSNISGQYIFGPWLIHYQIGITNVIAYGLFLIILIGLIYALLSKKNILFAFGLIWLFFFTGIATNTFPFSYINNFLYSISSGYSQAFRIAFTKFSFGLAFSNSIFLAMGLIFILSLLKKEVANKISLLLLLFCLLFLGFPYFKGNMFYKRLMLNVPNAYFDIMNYFKDKGDGRIADFPQDCPEGWYTYNWGYFGSGFYWYGIKQPFLSRTFDVWNSSNENYYWEISQALRSEDYHQIELILQKYDAKWIIYDRNLLNCRNQKVFLSQDKFFEYLANSPNFRVLNIFGSKNIEPIILFERINDKTDNYISIKDNLPNIGPVYSWNDKDLAYMENLDYLTKGDSFDVYYPFRSVFTKRGTQEKEFGLEDNANNLTFKNNVSIPNPSRIKIPVYSTTEKTFPLAIQLKQNGLENEISIKPILPKVFVGKNLVYGDTNFINIGQIKSTDAKNANMYVNGEKINLNELKNIYYSSFLSDENNHIQIVDQKLKDIFLWDQSNSSLNLLNQDNPEPIIKGQGKIRVEIPKIETSLYEFASSSENEKMIPKPCNEVEPTNRNKFEIGKDDKNEYIRLISQQSSQCLEFYLQNYPTSFSYVVDFVSRNISGINATFRVLTEDKTVLSTVPIQNNADLNDNYYILPPAYKYGLNYSIIYENTSFNNKKTVNDFGGLKLWRVPFNFIKGIEILNSSYINLGQDQTTTFNVKHDSPTQYLINIDSVNKKNNIVLYQSYNDGWKAYELECQNSGLKAYQPIAENLKCEMERMLPFLFGKEIKDHVLVNNWANGFLLRPTSGGASEGQGQVSQVVILFWPQYLEYIGFILLGISAFYIIRFRPQNRVTKDKRITK